MFQTLKSDHIGIEIGIWGHGIGDKLPLKSDHIGIEI